MTLERLSENIWFLPFEKRGDRPNLYYIKGEDFSISVDAGNSQRHVQKFYDALKEMDFPAPRYTVISHWHWDHTFGLKYIPSISIASMNCHRNLQKVSKWEWTKEKMAERERSKEDIPFCNENILLEYADLKEISVALPQILLPKDLTLDLGGVKAEILQRASTHCDDALYVYVKQDKAVIVEDADCEDFYHDGIYDQGVLKEMISFFEKTDYEYHCLGHAAAERKEEALNRLRGELHG